MTDVDSNVVVSAFTEDQVERLTGCTIHQLRYWDSTKFYSPEFADPNRRNSYSRVYSFRDLLSLQILGALKNDLNISLQHLRDVKEKLSHLGEEKWSRTKLYVVKKEVVFHDEDADERRGVISGQIVLPPIALEVVRSGMESRVAEMRQRDVTKVGKIERSRNISHNAWVIGGTRVPVAAIQSFEKAGYSIEKILQEYPSITKDDVLAALAHGKAA
jgi:DNA-binding transcriptional MerR regulator